MLAFVLDISVKNATNRQHGVTFDHSMVQYIHWSLTDLSEMAHHDRSQRCIDERGEGVGGEPGRERMGGGGGERER